MINEILSISMLLFCAANGAVDMTETSPIDVNVNMTTGITEIITEPVYIKHPELIAIENFLEEDQTDEHQYIKYYTCGHFARDLSRNASMAGLNISSIILTKNDYPIIKGYSNHAMNYFTVNGTIFFIEPQTDKVMTARDIWNMEYNYGKKYPDGTMIPINFRGNMAAGYNLSEHLDEVLPYNDYNCD